MNLKKERDLIISDDRSLRSNTIQIKQTENHINEAKDQLDILNQAKSILSNESKDPFDNNPVNKTLQLLDLSRQSVIRRLYREVDNQNAKLKDVSSNFPRTESLNSSLSNILKTINPDNSEKVKIPDLVSAFKNKRSFNFYS